MDKKYDLVGVNGNAYAVMGYVKKAMIETGFSEEECSKYIEDATSYDYNHLLRVSVQMIDDCNSRIS